MFVLSMKIKSSAPAYPRTPGAEGCDNSVGPKAGVHGVVSD